jgi:hypothetical protein
METIFILKDPFTCILFGGIPMTHPYLGKKGQSALEYLMTYGWALVVIVIAVAALVILINPSAIQGNTCDSKIGPFVISQTKLDPNSFQVVLVNQTGQSVSAMTMDVNGTSAGSNYSHVLTMSSTTMTAGEKKTFTLTPVGGALSTGSYSLSFGLNYHAGGLSGLTAKASCRGTI